MGDLKLPGLSTGIDTSEMVQQLMIINSRRLALYQLKKQQLEQHQSAFDDLQSTISALQSAANILSDSDNLETFNTSSADTDILTVSASADANPGSHSVDIDQLATNETWIHDNSTFSYKTDYVGAGTFIFSYNHWEVIVQTVENETTLEDLVNLINDDQNNTGVTAGLLYQGGKYHLMLSGQEAGEDYQISVNASSTEVWASSTEGGSFTEDSSYATLTTKITELAEFTENGGLQGDETITITGKNNFGTGLSPDYTLTITANTTIGHIIDAMNEHFDGVATARYEKGEIYLTDHISGTSGLEVSLSYDNGATGDTELTLPTMAVSTEGGAVTADLFTTADFSEIQSAQNSKIKIDGYPSDTAAEEQRLTLDTVATAGTFTLTYKGQTTAAINYNASTNDIKNALEALSTVDTGDITIGGTGLDQAGYTSFTFLSSAGDVEMISIDAGSLTGPGTLSFTEYTQGNNGWMHRNSNSISDALTGITLNLHDVTEAGSPIGISLSRNTSALRTKVATMVNAYNSFVAFMETNTEYNVETKQLGILNNDITVKFIENQARDKLSGIIDGFTDSIDAFIQISDIGLTVTGDGRLELNVSDFNNAVEEDFAAVTELLGAMKTGNSDSNVIKYYGASDKYTTAGTYHVKVQITDGALEWAKIKLPSESAWRFADIDGSLITGDSDFDDDVGGPLYPENGLQLTVDLSTDGAFGTDENPIVVRVKQGFAGALEDLLEDILSSNGTIETGKNTLDTKIKTMETTIANEEKRLDSIEERLFAKFVRMEKTMTLLQQQYSSVNALYNMVMGA